MPEYKDEVPIEFKPDSVIFSLPIVAAFLGKDWLDRVENIYRTQYSLEASLEENLHPISPWIFAYRKHFNNSAHPITNNLIKLERLADCIQSFKNQSGFDKFAEKLRDKKRSYRLFLNWKQQKFANEKALRLSSYRKKMMNEHRSFLFQIKKGKDTK